MIKLIFFIFLVSCGWVSFNGVPKTSEAIVPSYFHGEWITDCYDFGGGQLNKIYAKIYPDGKEEIANLYFAQAPCQGSYTMSDLDGNSIPKPRYLIDLSPQEVKNIPEKFSIWQARGAGATEDGESILVHHVSNDEFIEIVSFPVYHDDWNDWLNEPDVSGWVIDPVNYIPTQGKVKLIFYRGTLP